MGDGTLAELNIITVNAQAEFLDKLAGVDDPEAKRKIIGATFIDVFDREATALKDELAGPRHHLSRRHRIRSIKVWQGPCNQIPSQRGRSARAYDPEVSGAIAGVV
jgi:hypothetical protein